MDPAGERFWLARGACAGCGRPVATRMDGPGTRRVACNVCYATTTLDAVFVERRAGGPPVPVAPPPVREAPVAQRRRVWPWLAGGAGALLVVLVALALLLPAAPAATATQTLRLEVEDGVAHARVVTEPAVDLAEFPALGGWAFARSATPELPPDAAWTTCEATCGFTASASEYLFYRWGSGTINAGIFVPATGHLFRGPFLSADDAWRPVEFTGGIALQVTADRGSSVVRGHTPGEPPARLVTVDVSYLSSGSSSDVTLHVAQDGVLVGAAYLGFFGSATHTMETKVLDAPLSLRVALGDASDARDVDLSGCRHVRVPLTLSAGSAKFGTPTCAAQA